MRHYLPNRKKLDERLANLNEKRLSSLPPCINGMLAIPQCVLRSALYSIINTHIKMERENVEGMKIAGQGDIFIIFSGEILDQFDFEVWGECLKRVINIKFESEQIEFSRGEFLKALDRNFGGNDRILLDSSIERLVKASVEIVWGDMKYTGHLLNDSLINKETGNTIVSINSKLATLFQDDKWSYIDLKYSKALRGKPLALWLMCFYATHSKPFDLKVETLHRYCRSKELNMASFKQKLKRSLHALEIATGWKCEINGSNLVEIEKNKIK